MSPWDTLRTAPSPGWYHTNGTFSTSLRFLIDYQAFETHSDFILTYTDLISLTHCALLHVLSYPKDRTWVHKDAVHCYLSCTAPLPQGFPSRLPCHSAPQAAHSKRGFSAVQGVCAGPASDGVAEEFLQQHVWHCRGTCARGWPGAVHGTAWKAGTESQRQAACRTCLAKE